MFCAVEYEPQNNHKMKRMITTIIIVAGIFGQHLLAGPSEPSTKYSKTFIETEVLSVDNETAPRLEDWMISYIPAGIGQIITEPAYRLEDWMLVSGNHLFDTGAEVEPELEPWMNDPSAVVEDEIRIEKWMFVFHR